MGLDVVDQEKITRRSQIERTIFRELKKIAVEFDPKCEFFFKHGAMTEFFKFVKKKVPHEINRRYKKKIQEDDSFVFRIVFMMQEILKL